MALLVLFPKRQKENQYTIIDYVWCVPMSHFNFFDSYHERSVVFFPHTHRLAKFIQPSQYYQCC